MNAPKLVVTVALFTSMEDMDRDEVSAKNLQPNELTSDRFGLGLFVVTRRTNIHESPSASPHSGKRVLPERVVGQYESIGQAAHILVGEELGVQRPVLLRQTRIFDHPERDVRERTISITFWGFANLEDVAPVLGGRDQVGLELVNSSDFLDSWAEKHNLEDFDGVCRFGYRQAPQRGRTHSKFLPKDLGKEEILDQDHDEMVFLSWRSLRRGFTGKLDPFRFLGAKALPDAFRLSDLRELHDVSRGERSQSDQFRRSMLSESSFLVQSSLSESKQKRPGKPAALYSLQDWADPSKNESGTTEED